MAKRDSPQSIKPKQNIRWWPGLRILLLAFLAIVWVRAQTDWPFQRRNLTTAQIVLVTGIALLIWWTFISRAPNRLRLSLTYGIVGLLVMGALLFRLRGVSGDMVPILEFRWANKNAVTIQSKTLATSPTRQASTSDFPQFRGPDRNGILPGPQLATNWTAHPPQIIWRQIVGPAWSGFSVVGDICLTQEQRGENECVVARQLTSGKELWIHSDKARYHTIVAGEGPRATPTVVSNRVFTCGATGLLNCFDLFTGKILWSRDVLAVGGGKIPDWGVASSPLCVDGLVMVHGGEDGKNSLHAFRSDDGKLIWSSGVMNPSYASPSFGILAGTPQILAFNDGAISSHDPATGETLWQRPWGNGNVVCASPVVVSGNRVLFSSGYGVGAELLEISRTNSRFAVTVAWKSIRMKAKFSHLFARNGFLYGLDDGIFACVDLKDGSQRWKEGRYGHGQGLLAGDLYLLMAESGELVLLRPTPDAPNELARFRVFDSKTWNPIALAGNLLLVRNDREAACLRISLASD